MLRSSLFCALRAAFQVGGERPSGGGGDIGGPLDTSAIPLPQDPFSYSSPWLLFGGLAALAIALYLLHDSADFQRWASAEEKTAPDSYRGIIIGWATTILITAFGLLWFQRSSPGNEDLITDLLEYPGSAAPIFLIASIPPTAIAIVKYFIAIPMLRPTTADPAERNRSVTSAIIGGTISCINLAASVVTLIVNLR